MHTLSQCKTLIASILILIVTGQGCAHFHTYEPGQPEGIVVEINETARDNRIELKLLDDREFFGKHLLIASDSTRWKDDASGRIVCYPNTEIRHIVIINRRRGAARGAKIGGVVGFAAATFAFVFVGSLFAEDFEDDLPEIALSGLIGAAAGAFLYGYPIGYVIGERDIYRFEHPRAR